MKIKNNKIMNNHSELGNYKVSKLLSSNLQILGYHGLVRNLQEAVSLIKLKLNYIVRYSQRDKGFIGIIIPLSSFNTIEILDKNLEPFNSIGDSISRSLEFITDVQIKKKGLR